MEEVLFVHEKEFLEVEVRDDLCRRRPFHAEDQ